jgi:hypothetical protein
VTVSRYTAHAPQTPCRARRGNTLTAVLPARYSPAATQRPRPPEAHQQVLPAVICFPYQGSWSGFLVPRDPSEVSPLSGRVSPPIGGPIRPITGRPSLFPTSSTRCAVPFPCGQDTTRMGGAQRAYPVDCRGDALRSGWDLSPGGAFGCRYRPLPPVVRPTLPVWLRPISLFGRFRLTGCTVLHICSTFRASLGCPRLEAGRLRPLSPGLRTKLLPAMRAWVETPGHHRACDDSQYSTSSPLLVARSCRLKLRSVGRSPAPPPIQNRT